MGLFRRVWLKLYSWTKFPLVPIYGGFPVKLRTYVGAPIPYDSSLTPEDLAALVSTEMFLIKGGFFNLWTREFWESFVGVINIEATTMLGFFC